MKIFIFIAIFLPTLLFQGSCKKEAGCPTYELPKATQTGQNTIGCLIDGVVMVPTQGMTIGVHNPNTKRFSYNPKTGKMSFQIIFYASMRYYDCGFQKR